MKTEITIEVRCTEIDVMGHVNNAKYLEYMEWSREEWYNRNKLDFDTFKEMGLGTVTVNTNINYRKEAKQGDMLTISTAPMRRGRSSYVLKHEIYNQRGELVSDAEVTSVAIDLETRKSVPVPETLAMLFD